MFFRPETVPPVSRSLVPTYLLAPWPLGAPLVLLLFRRGSDVPRRGDTLTRRFLMLSLGARVDRLESLLNRGVGVGRFLLISFPPPRLGVERRGAWRR